MESNTFSSTASSCKGIAAQSCFQFWINTITKWFLFRLLSNCFTIDKGTTLPLINIMLYISIKEISFPLPISPSPHPPSTRTSHHLIGRAPSLILWWDDEKFLFGVQGMFRHYTLYSDPSRPWELIVFLL